MTRARLLIASPVLASAAAAPADSFFLTGDFSVDFAFLLAGTG